MTPDRYGHATLARVRLRMLFHAGVISLAFWYVGVALALTGHTKVLWGLQHVAEQAQRGAVRGYRTYRWLQGDGVVAPRDG